MVALEEIVKEAIYLGIKLDIKIKNAFKAVYQIHRCNSKLAVTMLIFDKIEEDYEKVNLLALVSELVFRGYKCKPLDSNIYFQHFCNSFNIHVALYYVSFEKRMVRPCCPKTA